MDSRLVQRTRYLLQARVRRAKSCPPPLFPAACLHLLSWVRHHPLLGAVVVDLRQSAAQFDGAIAEAEALARGASRGLAPVVARTIRDHAALCFRVLDSIATSASQPSNAGPEDEDDDDAHRHWPLVRALSALLYGEFKNDDDANVDRLRDIAVEGFYEYLDESIDSRNAMMGLLVKYKQRSEWFHRPRLRALARDGVAKHRAGEESLAVDLHEYIFDQGVEFSIEPTTASGEPDVVLLDVDGAKVVIDAKYVPKDAPPSVFKKKIAEGFHQVARYCADVHEPVGYLVVFIEDTKLPRLPTVASDGFEHFELKGKHVFYLPVVIADAPTASRAGIAEEVEVNADEIVTFVADVKPSGGPA